MKIGKIILPVMLILTLIPAVLTGPVYAKETIIIKIGSVASEHSPWGKAFKRISREWAKITGGKVKLKIYGGGIAGHEVEMVKKIRGGKLDGAGLSLSGTSLIYRDTSVLWTAYLFNGEKEFNDVFYRMKPFFEKEIEKKGFKVIAWQLIGWPRIFSKNPVFYPRDLEEHKFAVPVEDPEILQVLKDSGDHSVPIDYNDLMMNLQSGKVTAFLLHPYFAAVGQYYTQAPNMCSDKAITDIGVLLITKKTWENIPDKYKKQMIDVARKHLDDLYQEIVKLEEEAIEKMEEYDLIVNKFPADAWEKWHAAADKRIDELKGKAFSKEVYHQVRQYLKE